MTCGEIEPLIALYVEGDLPRRDTARVDAHLAECADCRKLLEDLRASQAVVKQLGSEAVDGAWLAAVRSGVLARIGEPGVGWNWRWAALLVSALALVVAFVLAPRKPVRELHPAPVAHTAPAPQAPATEPGTREAPPARTRRHVVRARTNRPRIRQTDPRPAEPLVVKMLTDDPNIVVIWLVDQTGD